MKKMHLKKKWVNLILIIQFILFLFLGSETENLNLFIFSKIIIMILMYLNHLILVNYSKFYEEGEINE